MAQMRILVVILFSLIVASILIAFIIINTEQNNRDTEGLAITDFSIETRAVCEQINETNCYYRCHDEIFLNVGGRETSIYKHKNYVCHDKSWVDPRVVK